MSSWRSALGACGLWFHGAYTPYFQCVESHHHEHHHTIHEHKHESKSETSRSNEDPFPQTQWDQFNHALHK